MSFTETFTEFYNNVKASLADGTFAKLTLAKTIGNTDLMNIYVRPIVEDGILKLELKYKFQQEEVVEIYSIDAAREKLNLLFACQIEQLPGPALPQKRGHQHIGVEHQPRPGHSLRCLRRPWRRAVFGAPN